MNSNDTNLLMDEDREPMQFLRMKEVCRLTGLTKSGIYFLIRKGTFPKSVPLGEKSVAWVQSEIQQWQRSCMEQR